MILIDCIYVFHYNKDIIYDLILLFLHKFLPVREQFPLILIIKIFLTLLNL